jgi:hypothetical protein
MTVEEVCKAILNEEAEMISLKAEKSSIDCANKRD